MKRADIREIPTRWPVLLILLLILLLALRAGSAEIWHPLPGSSTFTIRIDTSSLIWVDGRAEAWLWFEPNQPSRWQHWFGDPPLAPLAGSKEHVYVNCHARSYRIGEFEGLPRTARHLGQAQTALPGSEEATIIDWLCHA